MTVRYWHEFYGLDGVKNRFEILTDGGVAEEIICSPDAFSLEYPRVDKLDVFRSSQATLNLLSERNFQFVDLHTEDMQSHLVKFYRDGALIWIGYLDSETYNERITDMTPYPVEFYASDFFILERLKYRKADGTPYTDIVSLFTHIQRCFQKLNLPFGKLNIGCTTTPDGIDLLAAETVLHRTYVQSSNFYDEDNDAMTCKEVIEAILKPFGLSIIQVLGDVYICDMNTLYAPVKHDVLETQLGLLADNFGRIISFKTTGLGIPLKQYNMSDFSYMGDVSNNFKLTDLGYGRFMGQDGEYGFDTMINNVAITSSLYASDPTFEAEVNESSVYEEIEQDRLTDVEYFKQAKDIQVLSESGYFVIYFDRVLGRVGKKNTVAGCHMLYNTASNTPSYRIKYPDYISRVVNVSPNRIRYPFFLNVKCDVYASTVLNPLMNQAEKDVKNSGVLKLFCNFYVVNEFGTAIAYFNNTNDGVRGWNAVSGSIQQGKCVLWFSGSDLESSMLDRWVTNVNEGAPLDVPLLNIDESLIGKGIYIPPLYSGYYVFEITGKAIIQNPKTQNNVESSKIVQILTNNLSLSVVNSRGEGVATDDYEFKSYINKEVSSDYPDVELKCISANEENLPIGKGNILSINNGTFKIHTSFTRSDQTDILERLLMVTIHSNYTKKNQKFNAVIDLNEVNPLGYITYSSQLRGRFLLTGCRYDFNMASVTVSAVEFQKDTDKLSNIPYE